MTTEDLTEPTVDLSSTTDCKQLAQACAATVGIQIPEDINFVFWSLPILARMSVLINQLQKEIIDLKLATTKH